MEIKSTSIPEAKLQRGHDMDIFTTVPRNAWQVTLHGFERIRDICAPNEYHEPKRVMYTTSLTHTLNVNTTLNDIIMNINTNININICMYIYVYI